MAYIDNPFKVGLWYGMEEDGYSFTESEGRGVYVADREQSKRLYMEKLLRSGGELSEYKPKKLPVLFLSCLAGIIFALVFPVTSDYMLGFILDPIFLWLDTLVGRES